LLDIASQKPTLAEVIAADLINPCTLEVERATPPSFLEAFESIKTQNSIVLTVPRGQCLAYNPEAAMIRISLNSRDVECVLLNETFLRKICDNNGNVLWKRAESLD